MKKIFFILIIIFTFSCKETNLDSEKVNFKVIKQEVKITGEKYFDFDELIHYKSDFEEDKIGELFDNQNKSEIDKLKYGVLLDEIPNSINETDFISKLESIGYSKKVIKKSEFNSINKIFIEKKHAEPMYSACVYVYRDILIFKKKSKIIGIAKICFGCGANRIYGTKSNTEEFGQGGDYEKLEKILYKK